MEKDVYPEIKAIRLALEKINTDLERIADKICDVPNFVPDIPDLEEPGKIPNSLINHVGWKAKKISAGKYENGSLAFGWDFAKNFPETTLSFLESGPKTIDKYEFTYDTNFKTVKVKKAE